ncbi:AraC-type DNA-binding protein [Ekhidna lutea]|uniref:AraC-type DNA-binding protein n=1 Tax=Ekhidna lutea TaxID=447679 RepID=A0A239KBD6_EKHLU|nr:AraC family transcriptional regulator [Ekhidna lutea]SNT15260.1 AraC-type DNA-binding protein [Ekhidna lutea]
MYTQEKGLKEELLIVDAMIKLKTAGKPQKFVMVPDNKAEIIIPLDGDLTLKSIGSVRSLKMTYGNIYFLMPRRRGAEILLNEGVKSLILKINPIYARSIALKLKELCNGVFAMGRSEMMVKALKNAFDHNDVYQASDLIQEMCAMGMEVFNYNMTILDSIDQIRHTSGTISVKEIYSSLNVSKSKLEQHFNKEIGLTPKEFCRIEKINCFINSYNENEEQSLTELTYQCGYYDQSHLIKDFKYFLDTSPKKFFISQ